MLSEVPKHLVVTGFHSMSSWCENDESFKGKAFWLDSSVQILHEVKKVHEGWAQV